MDINLHYTEKGKGTPLILLHGNWEDHTYFKNQIDFLSKRYRVIAVDTRGHGKSERGTKEFTLNQFVEDLKDFMNMQDITEVVLLGFSDGGNIALLFALKYPQYVKGLILNGADLHPSGVKKIYQLPICMYYGWLVLLSHFSSKKKQEREMFSLMVTQPNIPAKILAKIKIPVLVIAGRCDMIKTSHTRMIAEHLPQAELKIIKGDHFIAAKQAEKFNQVVGEFLKKNFKSNGDHEKQAKINKK